MKRNYVRDVYKQSSISTASATQFIIMLLEACLRFLENGELAIQEKNLVDKNYYLQKAQQMILEIIPLVDQSNKEGKQLAIFCDYLNRRLLEANMTDSAEMIVEVREYVCELVDAWRDSIKCSRKKRYKGDLV